MKDSNEFYIVLLNNDRSDTSCVFENFDEAEEWIRDVATWDCRPSGGSNDQWYDAGSGITYHIISCDELGRF